MKEIEIKAKAFLKERIEIAWVEFCIENHLDIVDLLNLMVHDFGTKLEIQLPEFDEVESEEE
jgi:hypothetical protein